MISFRLSEDEYAGLKSLCINESARSVSDMARAAVHRMILNHPAPSTNHMEGAIHTLQNRIETLDREVRRLVQALDQKEAANAAAAGPSGGTAKSEH